MRLYALLGVLLVVSAWGGWLYWKGGDGERAANDTIKAVGQSNEISRATGERVDVQGAETRTRTERDREVVNARIDPAAGPADPDILRIAQEAHGRAVRAACRVQRTSDCPEAAAAPSQQRLDCVGVCVHRGSWSL